MSDPTRSPYPRPGVRDWALFAVGCTFVAAGLFILPSRSDVGIVTLAFFGTCTAMFGANLVRKYRFRRLQPIRVQIVGAVPIRPSRGGVFLLGGTLFALGVTLEIFGTAYGRIFSSLSFVIAGVGALLLVGLALRWLPVGYIQFDPAGLTFGQRRWAFMVPWDQIAKVGAGEFHDNPVLLLWIREPAAIQVDPPHHHARAVAGLASTMAWSGVHVMLMTSQYGMDLPLVAKAVERYVSDPSSRRELAQRFLPG
jgi:hypothetical protein